MSQGFAQITAHSISLQLDFPSPDETHFIFGISANDTNLQDADLALPKKPPRV
jgi:hypothetical protein